eukprot:2423680-Rhodomonas_salina.2
MTGGRSGTSTRPCQYGKICHGTKRAFHIPKCHGPESYKKAPSSEIKDIVVTKCTRGGSFDLIWQGSDLTKRCVPPRPGRRRRFLSTAHGSTGFGIGRP